MGRLINILTLVCFSILSFGQQKILSTSRLAGTFSFSLGNDKASGTVLVYPETDNTILFYVDLNRGAPSYNMGSLFGRLKIEDNTLTIATIEKSYDCGFGHGVTVDGTYKRKSTRVPESFETAEGIKYSFKTTTPENYNK
jgi:hypothetical protein